MTAKLARADHHRLPAVSYVATPLPDESALVALDAVFVSPVMFDEHRAVGELASLNALDAALNAAGVPIIPVAAGDLLPSDPRVRLRILHPPRGGLSASDNANSIALLVEFAGKRILLPGDLEPPGMERLIASPPCDCDVVLAPHHGSRRSNPRRFARWCRPEWIVVCGARQHHHPAAMSAYEASGAAVLATALEGAVRFSFAAARYQVAIWNAGRGWVDLPFARDLPPAANVPRTSPDRGGDQLCWRPVGQTAYFPRD